MAVGELAGGRP